MFIPPTAVTVRSATDPVVLVDVTGNILRVPHTALNATDRQAAADAAGDPTVLFVVTGVAMSFVPLRGGHGHATLLNKAQLRQQEVI